MSLIIGVDGGGTKSTYLVFNTSNNNISRHSGDSINFHSVGNAKACKAFDTAIGKIQLDREKISSIYVGSAALGIGDNPDFKHPFVKCISQYTGTYKITSDLYIGLKGIGSIPAIFLISGTGSMAIAEDASGKLYSVGGWGYLLGDQGSGYYIGITGIREAILANDGFIEKTVLLDRLKKYFSIDKTEQLIEKVYNPPIERNIIAGFGAEVIISASEGDKIAEAIINNAIDYLVKHVLILHDKMRKDNVSLGVYGGCFQKSEYFYTLFKNKLIHQRENISIGFPKYAPDEAALIMAGELAETKISENLIIQSRRK